MNEFFKKKAQDPAIESNPSPEIAFLPENEEAVPDEETAVARKKELLSNFTNKRFTEITRAANIYKEEIDINAGNNGMQIINMPALEMLITKIVEEKMAQYEMRAKMEQALKEQPSGHGGAMPQLKSKME